MTLISFSRRLLISVCLVASAVSGLCSGGSSAPDVAADTPLLELPAISVTDLRQLAPPESWRYSAVPGLEILTKASNQETRKLLRDFRLFNEAIDVVWPALKRHRPLPLSLIICDSGGFDAFTPGVARSSGRRKPTLLLRNSEHAAIVLDFAVKVFDFEGTAGVPRSMDNFQVDYYEQLDREYIHYLLGFTEPRLPAWLEEGLAQLFMGTTVDTRFIEFARIDDPNLAPVLAKMLNPTIMDWRDNIPAEDLDFNQVFRRRGLIPLDRFFAVSRRAAATMNPLGNLWSKQAKGLVHMWLYGEGGRYNRGFAKFVRRSGREQVTEAMFKECFGMSYASMLLAFRIYIQNTAYHYQQFEARKGGGLPEPAPLILRDATQAEIGRIKGDALMIAGHIEAARDEMLAAYVRGSIDGPLLASLGLLEVTRGETTRARKFLEAAALKQAVRPRAYLELAKLRYAEATAAAGSGLLGPEQTKSVLLPLFVARQQPPPLPEVYELMADVWIHSSATPGKSDFGAINQGVLLFQKRPVLLLHAAELNGKYGDPAEALLMANYGIEQSRTPEARQAFEAVKAALPSVPGKK